MEYVDMFARDIWRVKLRKPLKDYYADDWRDVITLMNSIESSGHLYIYNINGNEKKSDKNSVSMLALFYLRDYEKFSYKVYMSGGIEFKEMVHNGCKDPICDVNSFIKIMDYPKYELTDVQI